MAKIRITNLNKVKTSIRKRITRAMRDQDIRDGIGEIVVDQIRKEPTPVTSDATRAWRKYLEKGNKTHPSYSRQIINITFTGDLLKDLATNVKAKFGMGKASYILEHSTKKHKKYKKPSGKPVKGKSKSFQTISGFIIGHGYKYMLFSRRSKKRILKFVQMSIFRKLK